MKIEQVAAQLYTLRDFMKTPADIARSLKRVRQIGFQAVQVSGIGPIDEAELVQILDGEGLVCCATHEPTLKILDSPELVVERLNKLGCRYTAVPAPSGIPLNTLEEVKSYASRINSAGTVLRDAGQVLAYHNHHYEFQQVEGRIILDVIYSETDPNNLAGEIDTYWVQYGGGEPTAWCKKLAGRLPLLHLKDYAIDAENKPAYAEIGYGNLDWKSILGAAEEGGCEWYIIEQDTCAGDPFDSLAMSLRYLQENFTTAV